MRRREFITLLGGTAATWPLAARAQQPDALVRALLGRILRLQAQSLADKTSQFIDGIKSQVGWTVQLSWSAGTLNQRRFDALRLLRQVPAIRELSELDGAGIEQLKISRLAMDVVAAKTDYSADPKFTEAVAKGVYYGPVYFFPPERREGRPPPEPLEREEIDGLGILVTMTGGLIKVVTPIENMPAAKAGIMAGDIIVALDDAPVRGLTLGQAVEKLRGPADTRIKLTIMREGRDAPLELSITRALVREGSRVPRGATAGGPQTLEALPSQPQPYMTLSLGGARREVGVSVAEVNLIAIQDLVGKTKVGDHGVAYVVDGQSRVIAHSDASLVQRDFSSLAYVATGASGSVAGSAEVVRDINGREVLAAGAPVAAPGWRVFVELPVEETSTAGQ